MKRLAMIPLTLLIAVPVLTSKTNEVKNEAKKDNPVTVHEWGTFTSVADADGDPVRWAPWTGPADLPCFVHRDATVFKAEISGTVRMETPVMYFYAKQPATLSVKVGFPQGLITEWYPQGENKISLHGWPTLPEGGALAWNRVEVLPGENLKFPTSKSASHYFAARETDAAPLRVPANPSWPASTDIEQEKLLFYRGVGLFLPSLRPQLTSDGQLHIRNAGTEHIPMVIAFENRGGKLGYRVADGLDRELTMDMPNLTSNVGSLEAELATHLEAAGLYRKEALAMVHTWTDSWFEDGLRVFYILPRTEVDRVLPLAIAPAPSNIQRVFVGRVEVLSPWMKQRIDTAIKTNDSATLTKVGRFLEPFLKQNRPGVPVNRNVLNKLVAPQGDACVQ